MKPLKMTPSKVLPDLLKTSMASCTSDRLTVFCLATKSEMSTALPSVRVSCTDLRSPPRKNQTFMLTINF
jgi:hypothetical protein